MAQHQFTVDRLKGLRNFAKGKKVELQISAFYHKKYTPVLVSPKFLRKRGAGQIDIAYFNGEQVVLLESKSRLSCSPKQSRRLQLAQSYLAAIFKFPVCLKLVVATKFFY